MATDGVDRKGVDLVVEYLRERGVDFDIVDHEETTSAIAEAGATGVHPDQVAKTMVLRDGDDYRIVAIPASRRLDLAKARDALHASSHLRLATEDEMEVDLRRFDVGAAPPIGPLLSAPEVLDRHLLGRERILCAAGDHRHSVLIEPDQLVRVADAQVADLCDEEA